MRCLLIGWKRFRFELAEIVNGAAPALGTTGLADVAAMQDQPVMGMSLEFFRHEPLETCFDLHHVFSGRDSCAIRYPKDMGVDCNRLPSESRIQHNICRLSADTGERFERFTTLGDLAIVVA